MNGVARYAATSLRIVRNAQTARIVAMSWITKFIAFGDGIMTMTSVDVCIVKAEGMKTPSVGANSGEGNTQDYRPGYRRHYLPILLDGR